MKTPWHSASCLHRNKISSPLREWLFDPSSTTTRFRKITNNLKIKVLQQGWLKPNQSERRRLKLSARQLALIREVEIYCNDEPWMIGRTVIPAVTLTGKNSQLAFQLDERPLGEILFRDPTLQRSVFEFTLLKPGQKEYQSVEQFCDQNNKTIWARRSLFFLSQKPLLLTESFLPALVAYVENSIRKC